MSAEAESEPESTSPVESDERETPYRGATAKKKKLERGPAPTLWQRATYRWTAITAVLAGLLILYTQHPYYLGGQFAPFRSFYTPAFVLWLAFGLFYVRASLLKFQGMRFTMRDSGLHLLILAKTFHFEAFSKGQKVAVSLLGGALACLTAGMVIAGGALHLSSWVKPGCVILVVTLAVAFAKTFQPRRFWALARAKRIRTTLLSIVVKAFYTPLMVGFFTGHSNWLAREWLRHKHLPPLKIVVAHGAPWQQASSWLSQMRERLPDFFPSLHDFAGLLSVGAWTRDDIGWGLGIAYNLAFFTDCGWALMGYALESRWLGNKTRSVEPTWLGWAAALSCYPPYNNVTGTYLPLVDGKNWVLDNASAPWLKDIISGPDLALLLRGITVLLFIIYASATVSFGFKFSNLTNRGTVSRGPYRLMRHPAYACKCTAWWLEHLPTITLTKAFFLSLLCGVYALRAWTEERHLSLDPEYVAYKKKVPWVILPGVY